MSPLLKDQAIYTLEQLSNEYKQIPIQLKEKKSILDDEALIKKYEWHFALAFWLMIGSAFAYLVTH